MIEGLAFLTVILLVIFVYVLLILYLAKSLFRMGRAFFTTKWGCFGCLPVEGEDKRYFARLKAKLNLSFSEMFPLRIVIRIFLIVLALTAALYVHERQTWMGEKAAHLGAKEYFVTGQVLSFYRKVLTGVLKPDNPVMAPLNGLQRLIYDRGVRLLPRDDAEASLWYQMWFMYPYSRRDYIPYSRHADGDGNYPQRLWLDTIWPHLEKLSIQEFADPHMTAEYLKNYPGFAFYYALKQTFYFMRDEGRMLGPEHNALLYLMSNPEYVRRNRLMQHAMVRYHDLYAAVHMHEHFGKKHPKIEVLSIGARQIYNEFMIRYTIVQGSFSCDMKYLSDWVTYQNLFTGENRDGVLYTLKEPELQNMHSAFIDSPQAYFYKYVAQELCSHRVYAMMSKEFQIWGGKGGWSEEIEYATVKRWYEKELRLIKENLKGAEDGRQ
jgi:hypothetical protein